MAQVDVVKLLADTPWAFSDLLSQIPETASQKLVLTAWLLKTSSGETGVPKSVIPTQVKARIKSLSPMGFMISHGKLISPGAKNKYFTLENI